MIFPIVAVVVGALLVVCDADFAESLAATKAAHVRTLNGAGKNITPCD